MTNSVEMLGHDFRSRRRTLGAKERARRKEKMKSSSFCLLSSSQRLCMMNLRLSVLPCLCSGSHTQRSHRVTRRKELKQRIIIKKPKYMRKRVKKLRRVGAGPANIFSGKALGIPPTERLSLRGRWQKQLEKALAVFLSLFLEVSELEIEAELACMATLFLAEAV